MKKLVFISLIIMMFSLILADDPVPEPRTGLIHSSSWSDGYESVYLYRGTYHFGVSCYVTSSAPPGNLWIYAGIVSGEETWSAYGSTEDPITNYLCGTASPTFEIDTSGWYSVRMGAYAHYGCSVTNDTGSIYCDYTPVIVNND